MICWKGHFVCDLKDFNLLHCGLLKAHEIVRDCAWSRQCSHSIPGDLRTTLSKCFCKKSEDRSQIGSEIVHFAQPNNLTVSVFPSLDNSCSGMEVVLRKSDEKLFTLLN
jgi:hypothetical protein